MNIKISLISGLLMLPLFLNAAEVAENPSHEELRKLRADVIESITSGNFEKTLTYAHTNIVVTWQNNEVARGHAGLQEFFNQMGKDAFQNYIVPPKPDEPTILYGDDTGISFGETVASYQLLGKAFTFTNRWTATLVKENDQWLLAGYHVSLNALDNPILNGAKNSLIWTGVIVGIVGIVIGVFLGRKRDS